MQVSIWLCSVFENLILPSSGGRCGCGPVVLPLWLESRAVGSFLVYLMVASYLLVGVGERRVSAHNTQHPCDQHGSPWPGQALVCCCIMGGPEQEATSMRVFHCFSSSMPKLANSG